MEQLLIVRVTEKDGNVYEYRPLEKIKAEHVAREETKWENTERVELFAKVQEHEGDFVWARQ